MNKVGKFAQDVALSLFAYLRMVVVMGSVIAIHERDWVMFVLSLIAFYFTSHMITRLLDTSRNETIQALMELLRRMDETQES